MSILFDFLSHTQVNVAPYHNVNQLAWAKGQGMDWHQHENLQCIHVMKGKLEVDWGEGWQQINPHQCHILAPGIKHRVRSANGHHQFGINFSTQHDERGLLRELLHAFPKPLIINIPNPLLSDIFTRQSRLQLSSLDRYCAQLLNAAQSPAHNEEEGLKILQVIDQHLHLGSDVNQWAHLIGCSRATAQRRAKQHFGCGLAQLHEKRRMHQCAQTLINTTKSIEQIASDWGFADATTFGRAFRRYYQASPHHWRKEARLLGA